MNDIGVIHLTNGGFTVVDRDMVPKLTQVNWQLDSKGYVCRCTSSNGRQRRILMHREVNQTPEGVKTDHKNGYPIDNRRCNLRPASMQQNGANRKKGKGSYVSQFKGVSRIKNTSNKVWRAHIRLNGVGKHLGVFASELEAAQAYNLAAKQTFGDFARLNELPTILEN